MKTENCERDAGTLGHWDTGTGDGKKVGQEERREGELSVEPYINKRQVARRMGRTVRSVNNLMRRGMIPYYKLGHCVVFRWSEIQSHLARTCRVVRPTDH